MQGSRLVVGTVDDTKRVFLKAVYEENSGFVLCMTYCTTTNERQQTQPCR